MKLPVKKDEGSIPGGGFHYMLHPMEIASAPECAFYEQIGYVVIEVPQAIGVKLLEEARAALQHQCHVAILTEAALKGKK